MAVWLPFTQMGAFDPAQRTFVRGSGTTLVDARGNAVFDAISSVWTTIHGHCHPHITAAIARQAGMLDHATALGATNPVAEQLAERLAALTGLPWSFFASDGASAIEAALKIALQYWRNVGAPQRTRFVHLTSSYHGDTIGAMSVSDIEVFRRNFAALCFETLPYDALGTVLAREDVAAVIVEPIVQAAAGMRIVPPATYAPLQSTHEPLLIVDEIATGFGRTGTLFAFRQLGLRPDLLCVGKGITGGGLALSATLASERVFAAFLADSPLALRHLFHGHSYAANPIACAAALASLEVFEREATLDHAAAAAAHLAARLAPLRAHPRVRDIRQAGLMCGIELESAALAEGAGVTPAWGVADAMYARGHFTRPIGDVLQLVPPLTATLGELDRFVDTLLETLA
ncbi:MAG TPA: aminotransferase class III-fold pyridoxal phosphate-dependent enzyme [Candidatus Limnocylindria bacterium]|nr:aminotransferase class III-fold pyridoxal phosphate-dependent enzyme [Candidatus Limnocylindria bacterium]